MDDPLVNLAHILHMNVYALAVGISMVVLAGAIGAIHFLMIAPARARGNGSKFEGLALEGKAQVLSVEGTARPVTMGWGSGWRARDRAVQCRIGLRVEIPERPPYDVTVKRILDMVELAAMQPGRTVAVQADSANPQNVRIDFNQPMPPPVAGSSDSASPPAHGSMSYGEQPPFSEGQPPPGPPYDSPHRRYTRVLFWTFVGWLAAMAILVIIMIILYT
jgi:hypothetical protein